MKWDDINENNRAYFWMRMKKHRAFPQKGTEEEREQWMTDTKEKIKDEPTEDQLREFVHILMK